MRGLLCRLLDANRALGLRRMLWVAPQWLLRQEYLVLVKDLRLPLPEVPAHESLQWTGFTEAQIDRVLAINPALSEAEIRRRLKEGQECLLGWMGGVAGPLQMGRNSIALPSLPWENTPPLSRRYLRPRYIYASRVSRPWHPNGL